MRLMGMRLAVSGVGMAAVALLAACSSPALSPGTLTGQLRVVGGTVGSDRPVAGSVTISDGTTRQVQVANDGNFSVQLPPGTYTIVGHSPSVLAGTEQASCPVTQTASVTSGATVNVNAICSIK
jgi:hypothetical protein